MKRFDVQWSAGRVSEMPEGKWVRYDDARAVIDGLQALLNARDAEIDNYKAYSAEQTRKIEALAQTHVLYTWLRRKADQHPNDVVAVYMNIGHDWTPVQDLDRDLRTMIEAEQP